MGHPVLDIERPEKGHKITFDSHCIAGRRIGGAMSAVSRGVRLGAERPEGRHGAAAGRAEEGDRVVARTRQECLLETVPDGVRGERPRPAEGELNIARVQQQIGNQLPCTGWSIWSRTSFC